jgi:hypothetical protein
MSAILEYDNEWDEFYHVRNLLKNLSREQKKKMVEIINGGSWDENFFQTLRIILSRPRNEINDTDIKEINRNLEKLKTNDKCKLTNRIFCNPNTWVCNDINTNSTKDKRKLIDYMKEHNERKIKLRSHVFKNWTFLSNSVKNILRFDSKLIKLQNKLKSFVDEVEKEGEIDPVKYIYILNKIYTIASRKEPYYHPLEIYLNRTKAKNAKPAHCKNDSGEYDECIQILQKLNKIIKDNITREKKPFEFNNYDEFVEGMIKQAVKIYDDNENHESYMWWLKAYLYMFEPNHVPPNFTDDSVLLGIAKQYKYCLFTRKVIDTIPFE